MQQPTRQLPSLKSITCKALNELLPQECIEGISQARKPTLLYVYSHGNVAFTSMEKFKRWLIGAGIYTTNELDMEMEDSEYLSKCSAYVCQVDESSRMDKVYILETARQHDVPVVLYATNSIRLMKLHIQKYKGGFCWVNNSRTGMWDEVVKSFEIDKEQAVPKIQTPRVFYDSA